MTLQERFRGCLMGGALGDALGFPVEFLYLDYIKEKYGENGIRELVYDENDTALFSDDTQMSLFTASGLIWGEYLRSHEGRDVIKHGIYPSYLRWLYTQNSEERYPQYLREQEFETVGKAPRIMEYGGLYSMRAPGNTCITALESGRCGTVDRRINNSKGCGGIMRAAPAGLIYHADPERAGDIGAALAAATHGHPSGFIPSGVFAAIIARLANGETLPYAIEDSAGDLSAYTEAAETDRAVKLALELAGTDMAAECAVKKIGGGWTGEEALAIALYCALKYEKSPMEGLVASVNHDGDSDSTGALCGNIIGVMNGLEIFPEKWIRHIELSELITDMADALLAAEKDI